MFVSPQYLYVEMLTPIVMIFGDRAFEGSRALMHGMIALIKETQTTP